VRNGLLDEVNLRPTFVAMATTFVEFFQKLIKVVGVVVVAAAVVESRCLNYLKYLAEICTLTSAF